MSSKGTSKGKAATIRELAKQREASNDASASASAAATDATDASDVADVTESSDRIDIGEAASPKDREAVSSASDALVSQGVRQLMALFAAQLGGVSFPGVDAKALERAVEELSAKQGAVDAARSAVSAAEAELAASRDTLQRLAERALAYARIYAAEDAELSGELAAIQLAPQKPKSNRGRKPRAAAAAEAELAPEIQPEANA